MPSPSVTYTFINATTASATEVNANFTDIINSLSDSTKDLNVAAIIGTSLNITNNVTIGSSSADDVTFNASLASSIPIKTTRTYNVGSADLGLATAYFGGNSTHTVAVSAPGSGMTGDVTFTLPPTNGTANFYLRTDGSGVTTWVRPGSPDCFYAYKNTSSTVFDDSPHVLITFGAEEFDTNSTYDTTASRHTPTVAGKYLYTVSVLWQGTTGHIPQIKLCKNGSTTAGNFKYMSHRFTASATNYTAVFSAMFDMNGSTDYMEVYGINDTAGNVTVGNDQGATYFQGSWIGT